jgi:hypothetical protein
MPVARLASESTITTARNASAIRRAVTITWKHSSIVAGAITTCGASPGWPKIAASRSDCSTLVGRPVLGPPRCTSTTTSGISAMIESPRNSVFNANPGPDVIVNATFPAYEAPIATPAAAISSSAWWRTPPNRSNISPSRWDTEVAGVIGYIAASSIPAATAPSAIASFPLITTIGSRTGFASTWIRKSRLSWAQAYPSSNSWTFVAATCSDFFRNALSICSRQRSRLRS